MDANQAIRGGRSPYAGTVARPKKRWRGPGPPIAAAIGAVILLLLIVAYAIDSAHDNTIARGVKVGGIDVGGMSTTKARAVLAARLASVVNRPVTASFRGHRFTLTARQANVRADVDESVSEALARSRGGWFVGRAADVVLGRSLHADVAPSLSFSQAAVNDYVAGVTSSLDRKPQDAHVSWSIAGPHPVREEDGISVDASALRVAVTAALGGTGPHGIPIHAATTPAHVTVDQLAARYPSAIIVNRGAFTLKLYKHLKLAHTYPVGVGMQGLETPAGLYSIQWEQVNPSWYVPHDSWAGSLQGQVIPPGPQDPLKARWMAFNGGAGIHGIDPSEYSSIGETASHGCVRMTIPDVIDLYNQVKVGTPVYIGG
jgi:lipoprotein-anchoring transpeptidase ErfK/SrfK